MCVGSALALIPWLVHLDDTLHHPAYWVVLDSLEAAAALATALLVVRRSRRAVPTARILGGLLVLDAVTDVAAAHRPGHLLEAIAMALLVELPLAVLALGWAAHRAARGGQPSSRTSCRDASTPSEGAVAALAPGASTAPP